MSKPKLISFKLCPYVQRSVILLKEKGVDYDIEYIDVYDPPEWFLALSPTGKVPILQVEDTVLFESAVINEYLDEVYAPALHPSSPIRKAQNRAWMEFTSPMYMDTFNIMMAADKESSDTAIEGLNKNLAGLDKAMENTPWFNGADLSLIDISAAPLFTRLAFYKEHCDLDLLKGFLNLQAWSDGLLARQSVIESKVEGFDDMLLMRMGKIGTYINK
ncbi:MAG: glutathione S-transferase family protein [Thiotrichaceae bacterium]|nr:glutathione S-transferase family protein [Thiotrichaceae bacterium]